MESPAVAHRHEIGLEIEFLQVLSLAAAEDVVVDLILRRELLRSIASSRRMNSRLASFDSRLLGQRNRRQLVVVPMIADVGGKERIAFETELPRIIQELGKLLARGVGGFGRCPPRQAGNDREQTQVISQSQGGSFSLQR